MRFTVQKKAFEKVLGKAAATVDHGKTLPVLKGVLLEVLHDVLAVTAYDLEVAYEAALDVTQPTPGKALVDAAKLSSMTEVTVKVRISKSGQAMAQPGDLGVSLTPVKLGSSGLNLMVREPLQ
jgi:DNA polymerase III sliding clamp (beta) subunit (PCNA family)